MNYRYIALFLALLCIVLFFVVEPFHEAAFFLFAAMACLVAASMGGNDYNF